MIDLVIITAAITAFVLALPLVLYALRLRIELFHRGTRGGRGDMNPSTRVLHAVCRFFGLTPARFLRDGRQQHLDVRSGRHVAMWLLYLRGVSCQEMPRALGLKNHTSCMYRVHQLRNSERLHACALAIDEWLGRGSAAPNRRAA
jgi:hypothetical protein